MARRHFLFTLALMGVFAVQSAVQAAPKGPIQDYRGEVGPGTPGDPASYTIIINTRFWKIRDRIIIDVPPLLSTSLRVGGSAFVDPMSDGNSSIHTFYGLDANPGQDPMQLAGFDPALFGADGLHGEQYAYDNNDGLPPVVVDATALGPKTLAELTAMFPTFDFSSFGGSPSSVFYGFHGTVPTAAVPEPASLCALGLAACAALLRRRRTA